MLTFDAGLDETPSALLLPFFVPLLSGLGRLAWKSVMGDGGRWSGVEKWRSSTSTVFEMVTLTRGFSSSELDSSTRLRAPLDPEAGLPLPLLGTLTWGVCEAISTGFDKVGASTAMGSGADMMRRADKEGAEYTGKGEDKGVRGLKVIVCSVRCLLNRYKGVQGRRGIHQENGGEMVSQND